MIHIETYHVEAIKMPMKYKIIAAYLKRLFKVKKNGIFLLGISFFFLEIFTFFIMQMRKVMT